MAKPVDYSSILNPLKVDELISNWIKEDLPNFDYCAAAVGNKLATFTITCKQECIFAGGVFLKALYDKLDCAIELKAAEGSKLWPNDAVAIVRGLSKNLLLGERLGLNIISRCSGIAYQASLILEEIRLVDPKIRLAGTRKTTPGFRYVEKYGLIVGGADPHRYDLSSLLMIKDNHVDLHGGSIESLINKLDYVKPFGLKTEIECRNEDEVKDALKSNVDIIMLDNWEPREIERIAAAIKHAAPNVLVEVSGGIDPDNVLNYAYPNLVDIISSSRLIQGYPTIDFSMKYTP